MTDFPSDAPTPSYGVNLSKDYRVLNAEFGEGYSQRTPDGLNNIIEKWNMVWNIITANEKDILVEFFDLMQGSSSFNFTAPGEVVSKKWVAKTPVITPENPAYWNVTCIFERVYDLD